MKGLMGILVGGLIAVSSLAHAESVDQRALFAYLKVKAGTESQFVAAAKEVIELSRKEPGNLVYILHQSQKDPQQFLFYELFKSDADLQAHRKADHVVRFLKSVSPIVLPGQFILDEYTISGAKENLIRGF